MASLQTRKNTFKGEDFGKRLQDFIKEILGKMSVMSFHSIGDQEHYQVKV